MEHSRLRQSERLLHCLPKILQKNMKLMSFIEGPELAFHKALGCATTQNRNMS